MQGKCSCVGGGCRVNVPVWEEGASSIGGGGGGAGEGEEVSISVVGGKRESEKKERRKAGERGRGQEGDQGGKEALTKRDKRRNVFDLSRNTMTQKWTDGHF